MAITTLAGVKAGLQPPQYLNRSPLASGTTGRHYSLWSGTAGYPATGAFDNTLNGVALSAQVAGQIGWIDPNAGNAYLARLQAISATTGSLGSIMLCDRLWHNGNYDATSTSAQNSTSPTWPARDEAGNTTGVGVLLGLEVSAAMGAATPTATISYTNTAAAAGQSATNIFPTISAAVAGSFFPLSLAAGDVGVKSVQSLTLNTSWLSGTMNLVAYRVISILELGQQGVVGAIDAITAALPRMYAGSVPFIILNPSGAPSTGAILSAEIQYAWG